MCKILSKQFTEDERAHALGLVEEGIYRISMSGDREEILLSLNSVMDGLISLTNLRLKELTKK